MKKMTKQDFKNYIISEATKLYKAELLNEEVSTFKFKVKHDSGSFTITTTGSSMEAAKTKVANAEGCPESAITLVK
jgi:hypothetical protein